MAEREPGILIDPRSGIIRTPVAKRDRHAQHSRVHRIASHPAGRIEKSR